MSSALEFNYYETLEVENTATYQEIRESFKRLAMAHHPDKNPDDEEATARFQRINTAHENLKDANLRARHDEQLANPSEDYRSSSLDSAFGGIFVVRFNGGGFSSFADIWEDLTGERLYNPRGFRAEMYERRRRAAAREAAEEAEWRRIREERRAVEEHFREERRAREEAAEVIRQTELDNQRREEKRRQMAKEKKDIEEGRLQEDLWKSADATTEEEKRASCLHTRFWPKEKQKKKFKCDNCKQKGGMTAYRCPRCSLLACQLCLNTLNAERNAR